jgi:hypothetical protein
VLDSDPRKVTKTGVMQADTGEGDGDAIRRAALRLVENN